MPYAAEPSAFLLFSAHAMNHHPDLTLPPELFAQRRRELLAWGLGGLLPLQALAQNQSATWPTKPVQLIVPWPAGGQTDLTLRILCGDTEPLLLGQPIVVVNKPGAAGTLVAPALKATEPDGHTIGQVPITVYRHALLNHAPQHPGELVLGSTGIGTTAHLAMEEILMQHNVRYVHVPYKGTADQMLAIAGAQIMAGVNSTGFAPWVDRGQMRLLATFNAARNPSEERRVGKEGRS